ncbi:helix-turn-helix domain-containing protein [Corynebacterium antarcticum]|uniref:helix-turn-helix domain-containing protein n=1 Tax=Corynebacterium antarcticum TaxID=2800405 RepID=UPI002003DBE9|nr:helix-turn-helix domain-containing protein [Corynebacterium antarcticum]MCK7661995.1 helix-turn-helix domain-containing protein [Corynebacterium antarcticum]
MKYQIRTQILDQIRLNNALGSDEALARHLNLSLGTIQGLRRGRTPSVPTLVRICSAAGVSSIHAAIETPTPVAA